MLQDDCSQQSQSAAYENNFDVPVGFVHEFRWCDALYATRVFPATHAPYLPFHKGLVFWSGIFEVVLGILLLVPGTSRAAAWGMIALLIAVFPANIHVYQNQHLLPAPSLVHILRLPLQAVFILWAFWHTRP